MTAYRTLPTHTLSDPLCVFKNIDQPHARVRLHSPAILVMTDLRRAPAICVEADRPIDDALDKMKGAGVRLLFVGGDDDNIVGVVTSTDIQGELPVRLQRERLLRREDIVVRDIMTVTAKLELLWIGDVLDAAVGDVVETLRLSGRRHALVFDRDPERGRDAIRGIFSASQISLQLGQAIDTLPVARTFAEVELALKDSA